MEYPIVLGILLVASGSSSVACGLYAVQNNFRTPINRAFLALSVAMLIWCLGLAITVVATNAEICAFGRRLAPFGWGVICSMLLHFILLLTQKHDLLKKRWLYPLLYFPSAVTIFAYTYLPLIGLNRDHLIRNELGWLNISKTDFWDWFYYGYALIFVVISILLILSWARNSASENIKTQSKLLIASFLIASVCGSMTDVLPVFLQVRTPQFSPVFVLLPVVAVSYCVRYHGFMRPETKNQDELILNEASYTNVYRYIGLILAAASILNPVVQILLYRSTFSRSDFLFSVVLISATALIFLLNRINSDDSIKEMLLAAGLSFVIPIVTCGFISYRGITAWAFVFLLIIIFLLFNRRTVLITVIVSSILSQLLIWATAPSVWLRVDGTDYLLRIVFMVVAAILAFYVNRVYVQRLKDNANQIGMQMLMAETSHDFVSVSEQNFNAKMHSMLKRCGIFIGSDSAYIALFAADTKQPYYSCEWPGGGTATESSTFEKLGEEFQSVLLKRFESCNIVRLHDTRLMPAAESFRQQLDSRGIRALLALPIRKQDDIIGILGFTALGPLVRWHSEAFTYLKIITNIIVDAITKIDAEREINFIAYHDQLTLLPNRILFKDRLERNIRRAERSKTTFAVAFLDIDSFKMINDTMGHELGDQLLFEAARILSRSIRTDDMIARFGGDEFVILFNAVTGEEDISKIMDKIINAFHEPVLLNSREFFISVSVGIALYPRDGTDAKTLIKNADTAMYAAKTHGKSQYSLCSQHTRDSMQEDQ